MPKKNINVEQQKLAYNFFHSSEEEKKKVRLEFGLPTVSDFLVPLVEGIVTERPNTYISQIGLTLDYKLEITFNDQTKLIADHIIAATGYRFSLNNLPFLHSLIHKINHSELGEPIVNEHF